MVERLSDIPVANFLAAPTCCVCGRPLAGAVHVVPVDLPAPWPCPTYQGKAVAVVSRACYGDPVRWVLERRGDKVVYHAVEEMTARGLASCVR